MPSLDGRAVVVTGAASGIGRATATLFHERGARVLGVDIAEPAEPLPFELAQANLLDLDDVRRVLDRAAAPSGRIDALCNIAGGDPRVDRQTVWHATVDTNLTTAYYMTESAAHLLGEGSAVVNVSSLVGIVIGEGPSYSAAKAGIIGLTRAHARLLGSRGVRVNCVAPGVIETPLWGEGGVTDEWIRIVPLRRRGYPEDIARAIAFLCSEDAGYVSGTCLFVDGGLSTALGPEPEFLPPVGGEL